MTNARFHCALALVSFVAGCRSSCAELDRDVSLEAGTLAVSLEQHAGLPSWRGGGENRSRLHGTSKHGRVDVEIALDANCGRAAELASDPAGERIAYRCTSPPTEWGVVFLGGSGRAFVDARTFGAAGEPIDWPKIPDFDAAAPDLFRPHLFNHASELVVEEVGARHGEAPLVAFLVRMADVPTASYGSYGGGPDDIGMDLVDDFCESRGSAPKSPWMKAFEKVSAPLQAEVIAGLRARLLEPAPPPGAPPDIARRVALLRRVVELVDIDDDGLTDALAAHVRTLPKLGGPGDAAVAIAIRRMTRLRPALGGEVACELLNEHRALPGFARSAAFLAIAASETRCAKVAAHRADDDHESQEWWCPRAVNVARAADAGAPERAPSQRKLCTRRFLVDEAKVNVNLSLADTRAIVCSGDPLSPFGRGHLQFEAAAFSVQ